MLSSTRMSTSGQLVGGRYRLLEAIGSGGMAEVWRAHDEHLDRDVALKLLTGEPSGTRAENEARMAAKLVHPNIVQVYDVGTHENLDFVVMELVHGTPLSRLRDEGRLGSREKIVEIAAQLAGALEHAHRAGIVHCDVKPQNVIITDEGVAKLLDFGIAQRSAISAQRPDGEFYGSLPYVAPEQVRGEPLDGRADVYALGALLYELLTGHAPFKTESPEESLRLRLDSPPLSPHLVNPDVPATLERAVLRALATDPTDRFQSAGEFREALRASLPSAGASEAVTRRYPTGAVGRAAVSEMPRRRHRATPLAGLIAAGVVALALLGVLSAGSSHETPTSTAPALAEPPATAMPTSEPPPAIEPPPTPVPTRGAAPAIQPPSAPPAAPANAGPPAEPKPAPAQQVKQDEKESPGQAKKAGDPRGKRGRE
jgi:eukaryotic-like serine/threonine-protein kinase